MKTAMESLQDLVEEAKLRTVWWILCAFVVTYFLTHTSKSMLMNAPVAILLVAGLRVLLNEVEIRWKVQNNRPTSYLSHLEKKQLSVNDYRLSAPRPPQRWKRKIDSPIVEAAIEDFINKLMHDFVVDLWYSDITPDKEAPDLIHDLIMDVLGEVAGRIKEVNLVDLLTRDIVDLIGDHIDLFRRNQSAIGVDVMGTLSSEERDERLKHHLLSSKELHPALISSDCEYKVLQRLMSGLLAVVMRPRDVQCPLVRCIARELLTCLVMQPIMNFASPGYINELLEYIMLCNEEGKGVATDQSSNHGAHSHESALSGVHDQSTEFNMNKNMLSSNQGTDLSLVLSHKNVLDEGGSGDLITSTAQDESMQTRHAEWAKAFEAATQRRTEVLTPENLENMWAIGRNYKKKMRKTADSGIQASEVTGLVSDKGLKQPPIPRPQQKIQYLCMDPLSRSLELNKELLPKGSSTMHKMENSAPSSSHENRITLKRSNSTSDLKVQSNLGDVFTTEGNAPIINEYYSADTRKLNTQSTGSGSEMVFRREGYIPKLRCHVTGAYFEKHGSKSFAVYSIAVTDADNNTWFVKRRYRNFERLHRHLKDIPNYTLHLPPKRIFSSSTEDSFVHQRCIQLDKYLKDLLSIANVAEQHEVWDFLSSSSQNYSFGKSPSVMRTLAVNVDDAMDDIVRQFKGVSDGLMWKVAGTSVASSEQSSVASRHLSWNADDINKMSIRLNTPESINSYSDNDEGDKDVRHGEQESEVLAQANGWHSDLESNSKGLDENINNLDPDEAHALTLRAESSSLGRYTEPNLALTSVPQQDPTVVPPEWTPPNVSVPLLTLVDNLFQLKRRGWIRRQVFWISKQILQLVMEDAIDDWLFRQIQWLRREDIIAQGIRWVQDVLWPAGTFFLRLRTQEQPNDCETPEGSQQTTKQSGGVRAAQPGSFEQQLEAARRASDVKKMIFNGPPTTLVSLIGQKQYRKCARDIYYFLQSTVCLKQLGYGILELVLVSIFPELRDVVMEIHKNDPLKDVPKK